MRKKIIVRAPALSLSGYGEHARFALRSLRTAQDKFDIYLNNVPWGQTGWIHGDSEERKWLDGLIVNTFHYINNGGTFDMSLQITIPQEWEKLAPINIGATAGTETTKISPLWIEKSNIMDKIITVSEHTKYAFDTTSYTGQNEQTGQVTQNFRCTTPIEVVNYPVKIFEPAEIDLKLDTNFNFLAVATWSPRKNLENTVKWFIEEFIDNKAVGLVLKVAIRGGSIIDRYYSHERIKNLISQYKDRKCKIYLLHGDLTDEEMTAVYRNEKIKAMVSLSHGEGFGLPLFEAAYNGLPVIAPNWSGHLDFLYKPTENKKGKIKNKAHFAKIEYDLRKIQPDAVWENVLIPESMWCFPRTFSYKMKLREIKKNYRQFKSTANKLQSWILKEFEQEKQYKKFVDALGYEEIEIPEIKVID